MNSNYTTLIFDLFGTLVDVFSMPIHEVAVATMADILHIPLASFAPLWDEGTYPLRSIGIFSSIEENLTYICRSLNVPINNQQIAQAAHVRNEFTRLALQPKPGALAMLREIKRRGYQTGVITNCAPDVPATWKNTPFASLIDIPIFSCQVKLKKPDPAIYQLTLERLQVSPQTCLYVGDGSDRELTGAREVGMCPVLIQVPLTDAYDTQRSDVNLWRGKAINSLQDITMLLE